jgi:hypothetical protein
MTGSGWTCARCGVTASFISGAVGLHELPASWDRQDGVAYCLGCRRKLAGEAKSASLADEGSPGERLRADAEGRIEFELIRSPDRCDMRIARSCGANVTLVRQVRDRLAAYPTRPV